MTQENKHSHKLDRRQRRGVHKDWRVWVVIGLMLAAMFAYVVSDDESLQFGAGAPQQPVPAAVGP